MITHYQKSQLKTISKYHDKENKQVTCLDNVVSQRGNSLGKGTLRLSFERFKKILEPRNENKMLQAKERDS